MGAPLSAGSGPDFGLRRLAPDRGPRAAGMSTWRAIVAMARIQVWVWALSGLLVSGVVYIFPLVPGLVVRQFLDALSSGATFGPNLWTPLALLVAAGVASGVCFVGGFVAEQS